MVSIVDGVGFPEITSTDIAVDQQYFHDHPTRRYFRRPGPDGTTWVIRRRGRFRVGDGIPIPPVFLRALYRKQPFRFPDSDEALREAWFEAAYPDTPKAERDKLIKIARQVEPQIVRRR